MSFKIHYYKKKTETIKDAVSFDVEDGFIYFGRETSPRFLKAIKVDDVSSFERVEE